MHDVDSKSANNVLMALGIAASCMCLIVSAAMNSKYMFSLAPKGSVDAYIYAGGGIAIDVYMGLAPFFFFAAFKNREWMRSIFAIFIWISVTAFSAQSAIGHFATNRTSTMSGQRVASTNYADAREDLKQARKELGFVPEHRPTATVRAEIAKLQVNPTWIQTNECTLANGKIARAYCSQYQTLSAELGNAMQADKITTRIEALTAKSDKVSSEHTNVVADSDPQAVAMSDVSGYSERSMRSMVIFLGVFVFLLVAGMGPYVSFAPASTKRRRKMIDITPTLVPEELSPSTDAKAALGAPKKPAGGVLALQAPKVTRPEPSPEARALLAAIDSPLWPPSGDKRPEDPREHLAWRFLAWLTAHGLGGDYPAQRIDELYAEFAAADHRQPWEAMRVVKFELAKLKRYAWSSTPRHLNQRVQWTIRPPTIDKLMILLKKHGIAKEPPPAPKPKVEASSNRILPFRLGRSA